MPENSPAQIHEVREVVNYICDECGHTKGIYAEDCCAECFCEGCAEDDEQKCGECGSTEWVIPCGGSFGCCKGTMRELADDELFEGLLFRISNLEDLLRRTGCYEETGF